MAEENNRQFRRTYELVIGKPNSSKGLKIIGDEKTNEGLALGFTIKKHIDNKEQSNTCSIDLYNLSEDSIKYIQQDSMAVIFKIGYNGGNKLIFQGITSEVDTGDRGTGQDRKTTIKCVPSDTLTYIPNISKTFPANTTPKEIINYLVSQSTGINKASFNSENINKPFPFGYSVEGNVKSILNELSNDFDFQYRIDGKRLYVNDPNKYQSKNSVQKAFVISPSTGLLGVPVYASADGKRVKGDKKKKDGVKFTALANPLIAPGTAVSLKDSQIEGTYRVNSAEFRGDWKGNQWQVTCHCSKLNAAAA